MAALLNIPHVLGLGGSRALRDLESLCVSAHPASQLRLNILSTKSQRCRRAAGGQTEPSGVSPGRRASTLTADPLSLRIPCRPGAALASTPFRRLPLMARKTMLPSAAAASASGASGGPPKDLVLCFGEMLIDFVPTVNGVSLAEAPGFIPAPGGAPANVAVGVSRLGGHSAFLGKLGDEEFGRMLVGILERNGVDVRGVRMDSGARTALAFVTLRSDGEREFMFYRHPSADMLLTPQELDADVIAAAAVVHYGSISLIAEPCRSAHARLLELAQQGGALLSYDVNLRLPLWPSEDEARAMILSIWTQAHVAKLSEDEVAFLTPPGAGPSEEARAVFASSLPGLDELDRRALSLWHANLKVLLVTEGSKGSRYYLARGGGTGLVPGFKVTAVDATGAGDAFVAGFLVQLAENPGLLESEEELRRALSLANACGAITTTKRGAIPALPTREAAMELMQAGVTG